MTDYRRDVDCSHNIREINNQLSQVYVESQQDEKVLTNVQIIHSNCFVTEIPFLSGIWFLSL